MLAPSPSKWSRQVVGPGGDGQALISGYHARRAVTAAGRPANQNLIAAAQAAAKNQVQGLRRRLGLYGAGPGQNSAARCNSVHSRFPSPRQPTRRPEYHDLRKCDHLCSHDTNRRIRQDEVGIGDPLFFELGNSARLHRQLVQQPELAKSLGHHADQAIVYI